MTLPDEKALDMVEKKKFLGIERDALPLIGALAAICAPVLALVVIIIGFFNLMNDLRTEMAGMRAEMVALRTEIRADMAATRAELKADVAALRADQIALRAELKADIRVLSEDVVELKVDTAQIKVRVEEIAKRLPDLESVDSRLDSLEREQARILGLVGALQEPE